MGSLPNSTSAGGPLLRVNTDDLGDSPMNEKIPVTAVTPITPRSSLRNLEFASKSERPPFTPLLSLSASNALLNTNKVRNESRKLLAHVLDQLQTRPRPPSAFESIQKGGLKVDETGFGAVVETVRVAVKLKSLRETKAQKPGAVDEGDTDDEESGDRRFSTDVTFDIMNQLKDILVVSVAQRWQIFDDSLSTERGTAHEIYDWTPSSPFRLHRSSQSGKRTRSPSPSPVDNLKAPELLSKCISVLASIITEDCRFRTSSPRLMRPPNALQALALDIARFLAHTHKHDPRILSQIGLAVLPAFSSFSVEMHARLLEFFENSITRRMLEDLRRLQSKAGSVAAPAGCDGHGATVHPEASLVDGLGSPVVAIQVEEAQDESSLGLNDHPPWLQWSRSSPNETSNILSSRAPSQSVAVYYLASLVAPLLAAIFETVDLTTSSLNTLHRFHSLLNFIVESKPDACLDVLEVIAYHTAEARQTAISTLLSFWPKAVGHVVVGRPFPIIGSSETLVYPDSVGPQMRHCNDHPYTHQFVPWRFAPQATAPISDTLSRSSCRSCLGTIRGFGLLCPFCMSAVHFDCYDTPDGSFTSQYELITDSSTRKVAMYRFSHVLPMRSNLHPVILRKEQHAFRLVNIYTLTLCLACKNPLWGSVMQGLKCGSCNQFVHSCCLAKASHLDFPHCGSLQPNSDHISIRWDSLRHSFVDHYRELLHSEDTLAQRTHEEISICYALLWTQLQLLKNGVALGSIRLIQRRSIPADTHQAIDEFELHHFIHLYELYLFSGRLPMSTTMVEYVRQGHIVLSEHLFMFDWPTLVYITSVVKSPRDNIQSPAVNSSDLLNVDLPDQVLDLDLHHNSSYPYEIVTLAHMRDMLGIEFQVFSDAVARLLLSHLHHLGLFQRVDMKADLFHGAFSPSTIQCAFTVPLGLDLTTDVETLVTVVEVCLADLNISVNEVGFLLLVRNLWPNGMASDYGMRRLSRNVLSWVFAEPTSLETILRDYIAQRRNLPGVRSGLEQQPWPTPLNSRPVPASSSNNGGDYVDARRTLLMRYAAPWMLALHDQDSALYANMIWGLSMEIAEDEVPYVSVFSMNQESSEAMEKRQLVIANRALRFIIRLCQTHIAFSTFDVLFLNWLDMISNLPLRHELMSSLPRLFNREGESTHRFSTVVDATLAFGDASGDPHVDPWRVVINVASEGKEGLMRSFRWLCVFAQSGVDIPTSTFMRFFAFTRDFRLLLEESALLVEAALSSIWLKSLGRQELQSMISELHVRLVPEVLLRLNKREGVSNVLRFLRQSLATCLLLYGCERSTLLTHGIVEDDEIRHLPSRRKILTRASMVSDPIVMDVNLMSVIDKYISASDNQVSCLVGKFFNSFITEARLLESYEVDNFILRNCHTLSQCAWQFYGIQDHELSAIRTTLLLRILVVDSHPFQILLTQVFKPGSTWETRFQGVTRLFRIILDVTSPSFTVEGKQWRSSVTDIFFHYFRAMWADEREEIRLATDTWTQTLLPAHFEAITRCWNEFLARASIPERAELVSFLIHLHPHFPSWPVLSWGAIVESLLDVDFMESNGDNEEAPISAHLSLYGVSSKDSDIVNGHIDPDMDKLRVSLVILSLQMIADGVDTDVLSLLKFKIHLVKILGFSNPEAIQTSNGRTFYVQYGELESIRDSVLPCLGSLTMVLDAYHPLEVTPSCMGSPFGEDDKPSTVLIGSIFVDVVLNLLTDVRRAIALPCLSAKNLLECLMFVIHKHDMEAKPLKHLQGALRRAVRRVMDISLLDVNYELRQLALTVCQAYVKRWHSNMGNFSIELIEMAATLISSLHHNDEDSLVAQARTFIETILVMYAPNGVFNALCKRPLDRDFFVVLRRILEVNARTCFPDEPLRDVLLRDALIRAVDNEEYAFYTVMANLNMYVEVVHHQGYSVELLQFTGRCLDQIARRALEWSTVFDPGPLLLLSATVVQHNKAHSRELLVHIEPILRAILVKSPVTVKVLERILHVTSTIQRKATSDRAAPGQASPNHLAIVILDVLSESLRGKARVASPLTLASMSDVIMSTDSANSKDLHYLTTESLLRLATDAFLFLHVPVFSEPYSPEDFLASLAISKLVLCAVEHDSRFLGRQILEQPIERNTRSIWGVRAWNLLVLVTLSNSPHLSPMVFAHVNAFSITYRTALRSPGTTSSEFSAVEVNYAFAAIKLWILLAVKSSAQQQQVDGRRPDCALNAAVTLVWNELWSPFEKIVAASEIEAQTDGISPLSTVIWSSVADLFLFLRQGRIVVAQEASSQVQLLSRLNTLGRGESTMGKVSRSLRSITEPPQELSFDALIAQAANDVLTAEKLHAVDRREVGSRTVPDRTRKEARLAS